MKKIKYTLLIMLATFMSVTYAKADVISGGNNIPINGYLSQTAGNKLYEFNNSNVYETIGDVPKNFSFQFCYDGDVQSYSSTYFDDLTIIKSDSSCTYPGSSYTGGKVLYVFGTLNTTNNLNCSVSGTNCIYKNFNWYMSSSVSNSISLIQSAVSTDPFVYDYAGNNIINQNQQIIEQNKEVADKIDDLNESFNDCRDSYNELYLSDTSFTENGLTFTIKDNVIYIKGTSTGWTQTLYIPVHKTLNTTYTITSYLSGTTGGISPKLAYSSGGSDYYPTIYGSYTLPADAYLIQLYFIVDGGVTVDATIKFQLEKGTTSHSWELPGQEVCKNKIDDTNNKLDQTNQQLGDLNSNITNSDSSEATNSAGNFFSGFETDTFGLTSIITAPLDLIGSITSSSCSPLSLTIPFVNKPFNLPCMTTIYEDYFGDFLTIYQTITFGIVAYWVCVRIFALVKDFKNPDHDEIEVLDL